MGKYHSFGDIIKACAEVLQPPERLSVSEASAKYRQLNNPGAYVGPWRNETTPYSVEIMDTLASRDYKGTIFVAPAQVGKELCVNTPIVTPNGWRRMGDLRVGDYVYGQDGKPTKIVFVSEPTDKNDQYRITFIDGSYIDAGAEHRWTVEKYSHGELRGVFTLETHQMLADYITRSPKGKVRYNYAIPNCEPLEMEERDLPIDPYWLGFWLGDGSASASHITVNAGDWPEVRDFLLPTGSITGRGFTGSKVEISVRGVLDKMRSLNLMGNKHIPDSYKFASKSQRLALLQGLMDSDGTIDARGICEIGLSDKRLADDVYELLCSFGLKVSFKQKEAYCNGERKKDSYRMTFTPYAENVIPFRLCRYVERVKRKDEDTRRYREPMRRRIVSIEPLTEKVPMVCIAVDNESHLYLAGRQMVPTHNTDIILNWVLYSTVCDPADMIIYQTSQAVARDFSMRRIDRLHRHSPEVGKRLVPRRDADTVFTKHYISGSMLTMSWPTINEMSGRPVGRVALTDYDRMPLNIDGEGDPYTLAAKRTTTFGSFAMTFAESSPGHPVPPGQWMPKSKHEAPPAPGILALYNRGDRRRWQWPCDHCGKYYEPSFSLLVWPDTADIAEAAEQAQMACPHCGALHSPDRKFELNLRGKWVGEGQYVDADGVVRGEKSRSDIASFWLKGPAAAFSKWSTLVSNYIKAIEEFERTGSQEALKSTVNTDQGEPYVERSLSGTRLPEDLKNRAEDFGVDGPAVPEGVRFLTATIDVQANRFEVQVTGVVPPPNEGAPVDHVVVDRFAIVKSERKDDDGDTLWVKPATNPEDWDLITEQVLTKTYPLTDGSGRRMAIKMVGCDSGGRKGVTTQVYDFWRKLRREGMAGRFLPLKGTGEPRAPRINLTYPDTAYNGKRAIASGEVPVLMIQTDHIKDDLNNKLDRTEPGGMIRFSDTLPDEFYTELTVEAKNLKGKWDNPRKLRNEAWDLLVYHLALCSHLRVEHIQWDRPPGWADEWEYNDLVSEPERESSRFEPRKKTGNTSLKSLAELLG